MHRAHDGFICAGLMRVNLIPVGRIEWRDASELRPLAVDRRAIAAGEKSCTLGLAKPHCGKLLARELVAWFR